MREDISTVIDGYQVDLMWTDDSNSVHISHKKSNTSASLAYLQDSGRLYDRDMCDTHSVDEKTIERIEAWAEANGY